ncbi:MAG: ABC transporter ATP-binding protein [Erysipelotrichaceae bacterium]|nr:ABC transporter ATP-binding protein [Erysipelotrichaceae bacterium]
MLELKNIHIQYHAKECITHGHFIAYPYQITSIIGESGTGKSSLLYLIGMLSNQSCDYYYNDELLAYDDKQKREFRYQNISFISQNNQLINNISVEKNIEFYLQQSSCSFTVDELLEKVNLKDKKKAMPANLSGGEKQRAAIACALAKDSNIILGDEITSALDEDNTNIIMHILKKCASLGKIVIIVSHENNIIDQCDRVYCIDHLKLQLQKDSQAIQNNIVTSKIKTSPLKTFQLLFNPSIRQIIIAFIVMLCFFLSASIIRGAYSTSIAESYSIDDVSMNKILVLNNTSGKYDIDNYAYAIHYVDYQLPLSDDVLNQIDSIDHIASIYDYYTFSYSMEKPNGNPNYMDIQVIHDNQIVEEREYQDQYSEINGVITYDDVYFHIIPYYPEDNFGEDGIYINSNMAYYYHIEVGDTLQMNVNVPYAMAQTTSINEDGTSYESADCFGEQMHYEGECLGIIESNSTFECDVYLPYETMMNMINETVEKYHNGKIKIDESAFEGYSTIIELQPYAKVVYADKNENVLQIQNDINQIENTVAYNEYSSVLQLKEANDDMIHEAILYALLTVSVFIAGTIIIMYFYLRKYQSIYMTLNLIGYNHKDKHKIYFYQYLSFMMIIILLSIFIYISGSLPEIYSYISHINYNSIYFSMPETYLIYNLYCNFSSFHIVVFVILSFIVLGIVHIVVLKHYDKKDIIKYLRGK